MRKQDLLAILAFISLVFLLFVGVLAVIFASKDKKTNNSSASGTAIKETDQHVRMVPYPKPNGDVGYRISYY